MTIGTKKYKKNDNKINDPKYDFAKLLTTVFSPQKPFKDSKLKVSPNFLSGTGEKK